MGSKNYTCFIDIANIGMQFKGHVLVIKSRLEADFLLCVGEIHFVYKTFVDWCVICQSI